jgi:DNA-binding FrmR family transcriptional regulator
MWSAGAAGLSEWLWPQQLLPEWALPGCPFEVCSVAIAFVSLASYVGGVFNRLTFIPPLGMSQGMQKPMKDSCLKRLNRIEGQVRGLAKMVEDDRYCIDVVTQISAVRAALRRVEEEVLRDHVAHCVEHAIASGNAVEQRNKVAELMDVLVRSSR